jgi:hypothetical protein
LERGARDVIQPVECLSSKPSPAKKKKKFEKKNDSKSKTIIAIQREFALPWWL